MEKLTCAGRPNYYELYLFNILIHFIAKLYNTTKTIFFNRSVFNKSFYVMMCFFIFGLARK